MPFVDRYGKPAITLDGVEVVDGLRVWDYDLRRAVVDAKGTQDAHSESQYHQYWDGFFEMRTPEGERSSSMTGDRMWTKHPTTGEPA